jgi:xanthine dehydrogenase accessory factor
MIGSKRRVRLVREILLKEGFPEELVERVSAPIGVPIGAITPEEIAISIIAQVIRFRRIVKHSSEIRDEVPINWPEFDREVLEELSRDEDDPKAIVTIVSTKGSVPRKTGAKMLVWPYGKTLGSIGGGCSEGKVIRTAQEVIRTGEGQTLRIDMTGDLAEEEGMVCGGIMDVIIEPLGTYKHN